MDLLKGLFPFLEKRHVLEPVYVCISILKTLYIFTLTNDMGIFAHARVFSTVHFAFADGIFPMSRLLCKRSNTQHAKKC